MTTSPFSFTELRRNLPSTLANSTANVQRILKLKTDSDTFRRGLYRGTGLDEKLRHDYRTFRGWMDKNSKNTDSRHVVRINFGLWKAVIAQAIGSMPQFALKGRTEQFKDAAVVINKYLADQMAMNRFFHTWQMATGLWVNTGTGLVRKDWDRISYLSTERAVEVDEDLSVREVEVEVEETVYEGWIDRPVFLERFYWDPFGYDMRTCGWVIEQDDRFGVRDLERYFRMGVFQTDAATRAAISEMTNGEFNVSDNPRDDYQTLNPSSEGKTFRVDRYYSDEEVFFVLGEKYVLNQDREFQQNPFRIRHDHRKPYIHWHFWPLAGEFLGLGLAELSASSQFYASTAMNLELDGIRDNIHRKFLVKRGAISSTDDVRDRNGVILVDGELSEIRDLPPSRTMGFGLNIKETCRADNENDLGIGAIVQGRRIGGATSATEAAKVDMSARKQLTAPIQNQVNALEESARMAVAYNELLLEEDIVVWEGKTLPITGKMFDVRALDIEVDPESLSDDYDSNKQKRTEILAQSLMNSVKYGHVDVVAVDKARCRAAGARPEDFLILPGDNKPINVPTAIATILARIKETPVQAPPQGSQESAQAQGAVGGKIAAGGLPAPPPGAPPAGPSAMNVNGAQMMPGGISMNGANPLGVARNGNPRSALGEYDGKGLGQ
jgi:hypothetical protein